MKRWRIAAAVALVTAVVGMGWLSFSSAGRRVSLELACRFEDDRSACCALGSALTGEPSTDAGYVELLRDACVALDPSPEDPLAAECSCAVLVDAAASAGLDREALYVELETARCARTSNPRCPRLLPWRLLGSRAEGASDRSRPPTPASPTAVDAELSANILATGDASWTVRRTLVDRLLENQAALRAMARLVPHEEDGRVVGVKVFGIRRASLFGRLGLQNGDMVETLNGHGLVDPDDVLAASASLRAADHVTVWLVRRGVPVRLDYTIR